MTVEQVGEVVHQQFEVHVQAGRGLEDVLELWEYHSGDPLELEQAFLVLFVEHSESLAGLAVELQLGYEVEQAWQVQSGQVVD